MKTTATPSASQDRDAFEADFIYGPRRRERFAWFVAAAGVLVGVAGMVAGASLFPLKTTETFVVVVDKETGEMDRVAAVQALTLSESDAIIQANLVAYVDDRETYDLTDGEQRINSVLDRSDTPTKNAARRVRPSPRGSRPRATTTTASRARATSVPAISMTTGAIRISCFRKTPVSPPSSRPTTRAVSAR